ncbi:class F sortase [Rhodococcus sp. OK302]|uniref:class F sortase n=1 Tax=Rhodococcus sp. OK302 TaxID=1882769 RepID=UPI000B93F365|nr:class F sortase [Rhodococcus sp. OK302]OYD61219.1 sortase family protein [Rhodococcus sp. OK302]
MTESDGPRSAGRHRRTRPRIRSVVGLCLALALLVTGAVMLAVDARRPTPVDPHPPGVAHGESTGQAPEAIDRDALIEPNTLVLNRIGVRAPIVDATVPGGVLTPPDDVSMVGIWVDGAPLVADEGTTLLAGHVNLVGQGNGALFNLALMQPGDIVRTADSEGRPMSWRVTSVVDRPKVDGIEESVLDGPTGPRRLAVVTCGGDLSYANGVGNYEDNVYLYADQVN